MEFMKVRSCIYIFDGCKAVGRVKTQAQAKKYMQDAGKHRTRDGFESEVQKLIDFTCAIEDEFGYEFDSEKDVLDVMQKRWPEVFDVSVDFPGRRVRRVLLSGNGWHGTIDFRSDDNVVMTTESLDEITMFAASCRKYGMKPENYKQPFEARIGKEGVKKVMPVGFQNGMLVIRLRDGKREWLIDAVQAGRYLNA